MLQKIKTPSFTADKDEDDFPRAAVLKLWDGLLCHGKPFLYVPEALALCCFLSFSIHFCSVLFALNCSP